MINFTTGPVAVAEAVLEVLAKKPVSHREEVFKTLFQQTVSFFNHQLRVKDTFLLSGSGTLANEAMMYQIAGLSAKGLILSNGEFGNRLIGQATQTGLQFETLCLDAFNHFDIEEVELKAKASAARWILLCHCETSTGVVNNLEDISVLAQKYNASVFVDCMSTIGTRPLDLSMVAMATASSGKGLGSIPGLGLVFSNMEEYAVIRVPTYFNFAHYKACDGIPFTISSNLVEALSLASQLNMDNNKWLTTNHMANDLGLFLVDRGLLRSFRKGQRVFTISCGDQNSVEVAKAAAKLGFLISAHSGYLVRNNWVQVAMFSNYTREEVLGLQQVLEQIILSGNQRFGAAEKSMLPGSN